MLVQQEQLQAQSALQQSQETIRRKEEQLEEARETLLKEKAKVVEAQSDLTDAISTTVNSDEKAQLEQLQTEHQALQKTLADAKKELQEAYGRMSNIVQKKNEPVEELTNKVS